MTPWQIYWLTRLEPIGNFLHSMAVGLVFLTLVLAFLYGITKFASAEAADKSDDEAVSIAVTSGTKVFILGVILSTGSCFGSKLMPSRSDIAIILAGSWVTNNEEMQKLPDNVLGVVNKYLSGYLEEGEKK